MATFFSRTVRNVPTTSLKAFTSSSDSTIVLSILASATGASNVDISCDLLNSSDVARATIAKSIVVPVNANLDLIGNKLIVPSGNSLAVLASSSGISDITISYVEV